jgi:thymidylate synthase
MTKGNSLEDIWVKILEQVWKQGAEIQDADIEMLEIQNLDFSYINPFLIDVKKYKKYVPGNFIENIAKIYEENSEGWEGKNYSKYIYDAHGVDQIKKVISILKKEKLSKSAMVFLSDGTSNKSPCVVLLNFSIRNEQLNMNVVFKSSDLVKKFIPDMLALSTLHKKISNELNIARGQVSGLIFSAQLHDQDETILKDVLGNTDENEGFEHEAVLKNWDVAAVGWNKALYDKKHYVNFENGYSRFTKNLSKIMKVYFKNKKPKTIDVGSGTGYIAEILKGKVELCDVLDISSKMLNQISGNWGQVLQANVLDIPVNDCQYDFVVSRGVLISHVGPNNAEKMLQEINRILKPGAIFYFDYITRFNEDEIRHKKNKNSFSKNEIEYLVSRYGFKIEEHFDSDNFRVTSVLIRKSK